MKQEELDPQDQAIETSIYHDTEIIQQREDGLLSRWEADVSDILATTNNNGMDQAVPYDEQAQRVLISQISIRCLWNDVPALRQWITQFLASRQPDATVIAVGMAKRGITKIALNKQRAIEGYLVIGSAERELHGSVAEQIVEHLVIQGQISGYAIYTIPVILY